MLHDAFVARWLGELARRHAQSRVQPTHVILVALYEILIFDEMDIARSRRSLHPQRDLVGPTVEHSVVLAELEAHVELVVIDVHSRVGDMIEAGGQRVHHEMCGRALMAHHHDRAAPVA